MNVQEQLTPSEFLASISAPTPKSTPNSSRIKQFKGSDINAQSQLQKSHDISFEILRTRERRNSGAPLQHRVNDQCVIKSNCIPLIGRQFSDGKVHQNPLFRELSEKLAFWKSFSQKQTEINVGNEIKNTLLLVEKSYKESCNHDAEKRVSFPAFYFLDSILRTMFGTPAGKTILVNDHDLRMLFCGVNYLIRDYNSIVREALIILKLVKKYRTSMEKTIVSLSKKQIEIIDRFAYVPFVRDLAKEIKSTDEIFKCGILKERDIAPFYESLNLNGFQSLDKKISQQRMVDLILNPNEIQMAYGPIALPIKTSFAKEALRPLREIAKMLSDVETKLDIFEDEKYEERLILVNQPMGKIKELLKIALEELIGHLLKDMQTTEQDHYRDLLSKAFPRAQKEKKRNWLQAFEIFSELKNLIKQRKKLYLTRPQTWISTSAKTPAVQIPSLRPSQV